MARVNDRGQLLLAGAFVLAVALIRLTVVLASGGYTTTLASQDNAVERGTDAITVRKSVESDLERYLERANSQYSLYADRQTAFRTVVQELGPGLGDQHGHHGRLVEVVAGPSLTVHDGCQIELTSDDGFDRLDDDGTGNEEIVTDSKVRNVTFVFSDVPTGSSSFDVTFESGSQAWLLTVETMGGTDWEVTVERWSGTYSETCTRSGTSPDMVVDVSAATIDSEHCPALEAIEFGEDNYDVEIYGEIDSTEGRMWMTVGGTPPSASYDHVVYSARAPFRYHSSAVDYRTDLYVAPGEIR